eukprot:scaffold167211_cov46-Prasinocladus_malaysianus.AAC.1
MVKFGSGGPSVIYMAVGFGLGLPFPTLQDPEPMEVRLYTMLFKSAEPEAAEDFLDDLDPDSLEILQGAFGSPPLYAAKVIF